LKNLDKDVFTPIGTTKGHITKDVIINGIPVHYEGTQEGLRVLNTRPEAKTMKKLLKASLTPEAFTQKNDQFKAQALLQHAAESIQDLPTHYERVKYGNSLVDTVKNMKSVPSHLKSLFNKSVKQTLSLTK
jgi:hypothetical protein